MNKLMYALHNFNVADLEKERPNCPAPEIVTDDPLKICQQVGDCESDNLHWCVETFIGDENGEFVEGSDFESATDHYKRYANIPKWRRVLKPAKFYECTVCAYPVLVIYSTELRTRYATCPYCKSEMGGVDE